MKLFILGATGAIGQHLVRIALERGHEVTAFVRSPNKIPRHRHLKVLKGDVFNAAKLAHSMAGNNAVLSSFGTSTVWSTTLRRDFGRILATALRESKVRRVQAVSAAFLFPNIGFFGELLKATVFRQMIPDMAGMEVELCRNDFDWTMVRPPRLTHGPITSSVRVADGKLPARGSSISRVDVANFMIGEAENPKHVKQIVGLSN